MWHTLSSWSPWKVLCDLQHSYTTHGHVTAQVVRCQLLNKTVHVQSHWCPYRIWAWKGRLEEVNLQTLWISLSVIVPAKFHIHLSVMWGSLEATFHSDIAHTATSVKKIHYSQANCSHSFVKLTARITTDKVLWESCKLCFKEVMSHHRVKNVLVYIRQLVMHLEGCCAIKYCHLVWYLRTVKLSIKLWLEWRGIQIVRTNIHTHNSHYLYQAQIKI
jgi:hypothetical protein